MMPWVEEAQKHIGQREVSGSLSNPWIKSMWLSLKGGAWFWKAYKEDDSLLPWCGGFLAFCFNEGGRVYPKNYASALAWLAWGVPLDQPVYGCVVVFRRAGGGHVGLIVGADATGRLMVLGANQNNAVSIAPFERERVAGYRLPVGAIIKLRGTLPLLESNVTSSTNEA